MALDSKSNDGQNLEISMIFAHKRGSMFCHHLTFGAVALGCGGTEAGIGCWWQRGGLVCIIDHYKLDRKKKVVIVLYA